MTTTEPEIRVFAMFPRDPQSSDWNWVHCLTFPVETLKKLQFSQRLYTWIRYAMGVVVGAQGNLSFSSNLPPDVIDYDVVLPSNSADLYYHIGDGERQRMFPADPDVNRTDSTSSDATAQMEFLSDVVERDRATGDKYIKTYTRHRTRDPAGKDIVDKVDDIRNGILLNPVAHRTLGSFIALLMTPNFAMSTMDIDPSASPTEKRCTAHLFVPDEPQYFGDSAVHPGSPARMPAKDWPPDILFDAVYAGVVLRHFAAPTLQDTLKERKSTFYPQGVMDAIADERAAHWQRERRNERKHARDLRARNDCDYFDVLMMLPYILMPQDQREAVLREEEMERSRLEDKVVGWAMDVAAARSP